MALENQPKFIDSFTYIDETFVPHNVPGELKHILVFGQSRQGKSSIINLMLGREEANVSSDAIGCTFKTTPYWNNNYCFWDTAGLDEQSGGEVTGSESTKMLINFIKKSKGFHGAIMVTTWQSINDTATKRNWDLFYDSFLDNRVPIIICITGRGIESSENDQNWINSQQETFVKLGFSRGKPHKCVVYSKPMFEVSPMFKQPYGVLRQRSKNYIDQLLSMNVNDEFYSPVAELGLLNIIKKVVNTFLKLIGMNSLMFEVRDGFFELLIKLGFSERDAKEISCETI